MLPITRVDTGPLPDDADDWYVIEQRNPFGYPNNEIPGEDKRTLKVIAGPLSRMGADSYIKTSTVRDDVPRHIHSFRVLPGDLVKSYS
jgi:hypothetical protein